MSTETNKIPSREELASGKIYAEIMNLLEDTRKKEDEREKLRTETKWYPVRYLGGVFIAAVIFLGAVIAAVKAFLP